ncbi:MAG: hypothetical protein RRY65_06725, partial [Pseudoflavonifractor sp.]
SLGMPVWDKTAGPQCSPYHKTEHLIDYIPATFFSLNHTISRQNINPYFPYPSSSAATGMIGNTYGTMNAFIFLKLLWNIY